ncbi:MAG TPA: glycosyltransferase family 39 protein [Thermodesulfobacteriota bacterium]|nr:glycosyltransferase family 39 protein [Thermodesulfobacteriota bacterium]
MTKLKLRREGLALAAVLLIGLFLRLYDLGGESVWLDEAFSIQMAKSNLSGVIEATTQDTYPPLYPILLHYWVGFLGDSEFSTRFMSVLFGFLAVLMIYKVGILVSDRETGILSALILALSNFHIYYSQEARMYSLMVLLTLASMYFFLRMLKSEGRADSIGYILSSSLLMYTHIYGLFIIIAQNIYSFTELILERKDSKLNLKKWILLQLILAVLFSPWVTVFMEQVIRAQSGKRIGWIPVPSVQSIINSFKLYSGSYLLLSLFLVLSFFSVVGFKKFGEGIYWRDLFASMRGYRWKIYLSNIKTGYFLLVWLSCPVILPFLISKFFTPIYWYRYTIVASLAFYLLAAIGIRNLGPKLKFAVITLIVLGFLANVWEGYSTVNKERWREMVDYIDTNASEGDLVLFNANYAQIPFDYYSKRTDLVKKPFPEETNIVDEDSVKKLDSSVKDYNRVWVVLAHSYDSQGLIKKSLDQSHNLLSSREYIGMSYASNDEHHKLEASLFEKK